MRIGPQLECQDCALPILLAFAVAEGARRVLGCPACGRVHVWVVADLDRTSGDPSPSRHGSSVE